jgi:MFS family permease
MLSKLVVNKYNLWVVIFVATGTISTAYGLAVIGSTVGQPNFYTYFNLATAGEPGYTRTTNLIGALNGVNSAGAIAGCIHNSWSSDAMGRKYTMMIGSAILIVGGALCSGSVNLAMFLVGRFIAGWGAGVLACVVPMYQAEVSTPETRGAMVSITGVCPRSTQSLSSGIYLRDIDHVRTRVFSCWLARLWMLFPPCNFEIRVILVAFPSGLPMSVSHHIASGISLHSIFTTMAALSRTPRGSF